MLYEMIIMSSTSQLYCQTKMNLKKVIFCKKRSLSAMDIVL